jgi:tRNA G18 (ribose-2'-O)-methylase SpoU
MRGYFGVGVDGVSKAMNLGNLQRIAHAFGASFFFTINSQVKTRHVESADTSRASGHMPTYRYRHASELRLPQGCRLIGIEITEDAVELPRFRHPSRAAYVLGSERMSLSPETLALCEFVVKIPLRFSINVGMAGAITMYDRMLSLGNYGDRPVRPGGASDTVPPEHSWGAPMARIARDS